MLRFASVLGLATIIGVSAGAHVLFDRPASTCFKIGNLAYEISAPTRDADLRIRLDNAADRPDIAIRLIDDPAQADFVLVDDTARTQSCQSGTRRRLVSIGQDVPSPHLTIRVSRQTQAGDRTLYFDSEALSQEQAAALVAAFALQQRQLATRDEHPPLH